MDIKSISTINLPSANYYQKNNEKPSEAETSTKNSAKQVIKKAFPYVTGAVILAGLGIYAYTHRENFGRGGLKNIEEYATRIGEGLKNKRSTLEETAETVTEQIEKTVPKAENTVTELTTETSKTVVPTEPIVKSSSTQIKEVTAEAPKAETSVQNASTEIKEVTAEAPKAETSVQNASTEIKEVTAEAPKAETPAQNDVAEAKNKETSVKKTKKEQLRETVQKTLEGLNLHDEKIVATIERNRKEQQSEIDRIINENIVDGHVDLKMMNKIAKDFMADEKNRGADRFHQAADILEQSLIRECVRGGEREMGGLDNYLEESGKTILYKVYRNMPIEESASRLRYLADHDFASSWYSTDITATQWFMSSMEKLVKKYDLYKPV